MTRPALPLLALVVLAPGCLKEHFIRDGAGCDQEGYCPPGMVCSTTGTCLFPCPEPGCTGEACGCDGLEVLDPTWPRACGEDGLCHRLCQQSGCYDGTTCDTTLGVCARNCGGSPELDCPPGLSCILVSGPTGFCRAD